MKTISSCKLQIIYWTWLELGTLFFCGFTFLDVHLEDTGAAASPAPHWPEDLDGGLRGAGAPGPQWVGVSRPVAVMLGSAASEEAGGS